MSRSLMSLLSIGKITQLGIRVALYFEHDDFPSSSNVRYGHSLTKSLQQAPQRRHSPLHFEELSSTYFLLNTYRKNRRMTPDSSSSLCATDTPEASLAGSAGLFSMTDRLFELDSASIPKFADLRQGAECLSIQICSPPSDNGTVTGEFAAPLDRAPWQNYIMRRA